MAEGLAGRGRIDDALRLARQAVTAARAALTNSSLATTSVLVQSQLVLATVLARANRTAEAGQVAASVSTALESNPKKFRNGWLRAYLYSQLGRIYQQSGQSRQARVWFGKSREAWMNRGRALVLGAPPKGDPAPGHGPGYFAGQALKRCPASGTTAG